MPTPLKPRSGAVPPSEQVTPEEKARLDQAEAFNTMDSGRLLAVIAQAFLRMADAVESIDRSVQDYVYDDDGDDSEEGPANAETGHR